MPNHIKIKTLLIFICLLFGCSPRHVTEDGWSQITTKHFTIITNGNTGEISNLAKELEHFRLFVSDLTNIPLSDTDKLTVFIAESTDVYERLIAEERTSTVGAYYSLDYQDFAIVNKGAYQRTGKSHLYWAKRFLFHEYVHFLQDKSSSIPYPFWYREGYAEMLSTIQIDNENLEIRYGRVPKDRVYSLLTNKIMPLSKLLILEQPKMFAEEGDKFYSSSWLFTHMLFDNPKYIEMLNQYLLEQASKGNSLKVFEKNFGKSINEMDEELKEYLNKNTISWLNISLKEKLPIIDLNIISYDKYKASSLLVNFFSLSRKGSDKIIALKNEFTDEQLEKTTLDYSLMLALLKENKLAESMELMAKLMQDEALDPWAKFTKAEWLSTYAFTQDSLDEKSKERLLKQSYTFYLDVLNTDPNNSSAWVGLGRTAKYLGVSSHKLLVYFKKAYLINMRNKAALDEYLAALEATKSWQEMSNLLNNLLLVTPQKHRKEYFIKKLNAANAELERVSSKISPL